MYVEPGLRDPALYGVSGGAKASDNAALQYCRLLFDQLTNPEIIARNKQLVLVDVETIIVERQKYASAAKCRATQGGFQGFTTSISTDFAYLPSICSTNRRIGHFVPICLRD